MFSKKSIALFLLSLALLTGCAAVTSVVVEEKIVSALSGREGIDGPVLVVKIDDSNAAHPQIGVEDAEIVYIQQVEGGATRLAAIYSTVIPMRVGPVRSGRISDLEIMSQFGRVAFAYSGAQSKLLPVIASSNLVDLGAQRQSPQIYTTDQSRRSPYAMVLRADLLMQKIIDSGFQVDTAKNVGFQFGELQEGGLPTQEVVINWPAATYSAVWSEAESRWHLFHNGRLNLADSGLVLGPTTLIIQMVSVTDSDYGDKFGGVTPLIRTVGTGKAYVLRNGQKFVTTWSRSSPETGTSFSFSDGTRMNFDPGQIWVALTDREPIFTSRPVDQTK